MEKKKWIAVFLAVALIISVLPTFAAVEIHSEEAEATTEPPTEAETEPPTEAETEAPTEAETEAPTEAETEAPTEAETEAPTEAETEAPTEAETEAPTEAETEAPTEAETEAPTEAETEAPTEAETEAPTEAETEAPTEAETEAPTEAETEAPTEAETEAPTEAETEAPTEEAFLASGDCGSGLTWTLDDTGTLTVSGTGEMQSSDYPWSAYSGEILCVVLQEGVPSVGAHAFAGCGNLSAISIANGTSGLTLGEGCFANTNLTEIYLPSRVSAIGSESFAGCAALLKITCATDAVEALVLNAGSVTTSGVVLSVDGDTAYYTYTAESGWVLTEATEETTEPTEETTDPTEESTEPTEETTDPTEDPTEAPTEEAETVCVTTWQWNDPEEYLTVDQTTGAYVLALGGADTEDPENNPTLEDIIEILPASVTALVDGEELEIALTWACADYPETDVPSGSYTFTAALPEGCTLAEDAAALTVTVSFGDTMEVEITADGGTLAEGDYTLSEDITLTTENLAISSGTVTIDLNGHKITGNGNGSVITVSGGTLIIKGTGTITGGDVSSGDGGAICISSGTVTLAGGTLSGNKAKRGGAVFVNSGAEFIMSGGEISGNTAAYNGGGGNGGGVFVHADSGSGTFTMSGGSISGNSAEVQGGGVFINSNTKQGTKGSMTMEGGSISGNTAGIGGGICVNGTLTMSGGSITGNSIAGTTNSINQEKQISGGGVKVNDGTFIMSGGSISGNTATSSGSYTAMGGGVYVERMESGKTKTSSVFQVSGGAFVTDNTVNGAANNVYLPTNQCITLGGSNFSGTIGVTTATAPEENSTSYIQITTAETNYYSTAYQNFSADAEHAIAEANSTENYVQLSYAYIVTLNLTNITTSDSATTTKVKIGGSYSADLTASDGYTLPDSIDNTTVTYVKNADKTTGSVSISAVNQDTTITAAGVAITYTVTIPVTWDVNSNSTATLNVNVNNFPSTKALSISVTSGNGFKMVNTTAPNDSLTYTLKYGDTTLNNVSGGLIKTFNPNTENTTSWSVPLTITHGTAPYVATYEDVLTFTTAIVTVN